MGGAKWWSRRGGRGRARTQRTISTMRAAAWSNTRRPFSSVPLSASPITPASVYVDVHSTSSPGCFQRRGRCHPGALDHFHHVGERLRCEIEALGGRHGFAFQAPGEDAVFGVRFTDRRPLRTWEDLLTSDKDLNLRWSVELLKRGILVNPNEKFYISLAHTSADVDRTLAACDEAFAALA